MSGQGTSRGPAVATEATIGSWGKDVPLVECLALRMGTALLDLVSVEASKVKTMSPSCPSWDKDPSENVATPGCVWPPLQSKLWESRLSTPGFHSGVPLSQFPGPQGLSFCR